MAVMDNVFSLLGDEEGDDVTVLVEHLVKKVEVFSTTQSKQERESFAQSDKGDQGRGRGRGGYWVNDDFQNDYRRNYYQDSYGNGEGNAAGDGFRGRGSGGGFRGRRGGRGRGRGRAFNDEFGQQNVVRSNYNEGGEYQAEQGYAGWDDERRIHRNGGRYSGGERSGRGYQGQYKNKDAVEQPKGEGDFNGDRQFGEEEVTYRNGNQNYVSERRGFGGSRARGRREYQRTDNGEVKESGFAGDADKSNGGSEVPAENEISVEGNGDVAETTDPGSNSLKLSEEEERVQKEKEERRQRREEERKQESSLMTLDQYEKMLLEKRKSLESQKAEERKVFVDKELEGMQLVKKKADEGIKLVFEEKPKKKDSLQEKGIQKYEDKKKKKKKDTLEKEKARKLMPVDIAGFLKPASFCDGRREGRREFGGGDEGGFRGQYSSSRVGWANDGGSREQRVGDEGGSKGKYSSRGSDEGSFRGGNSYRGGRTSNAGREQSRGGRGPSDEGSSSGGLHPAEGNRTHNDSGRTKAAAVGINPYDKDFPVLGAKASSVPAATSAVKA